jgi:hypothetical protein
MTRPPKPDNDADLQDVGAPQALWDTIENDLAAGWRVIAVFERASDGELEATWFDWASSPAVPGIGAPGFGPWFGKLDPSAPGVRTMVTRIARQDEPSAMVAKVIGVGAVGDVDVTTVLGFGAKHVGAADVGKDFGRLAESNMGQTLSGMLIPMDVAAEAARVVELAVRVGSAADVADAAIERDTNFARALQQHLARRLTDERLTRFEEVWALSASQAAKIFGVSRQAYAKWSTQIPPERQSDVALVEDITRLLLRYVAVDRIATVLRRNAEALDGRSLLDMANDGLLSDVHAAVRTMFDLRRVQP